MPYFNPIHAHEICMLIKFVVFLYPKKLVMDPIRSYFSYIDQAIRAHWTAPALSDYEGSLSYSYGQVAEQVMQFGRLFSEAGLRPGDHIAIVGRNAANWAIAYLAIAAYRAVAVTIQPDFAPNKIAALLKHSDSKALFGDSYVLSRLKPYLKDLPLKVRWSFEDIKPNDTVTISQDELVLPTDNQDDLALINYIDDGVDIPKGVMLTHRAISSNVMFGQNSIPSGGDKHILALLPLSQMLGFIFEFLSPLAGGAHICFVTKSLSPAQLIEAYRVVQPYMVVTIPHVAESIVHRTTDRDVKTVLRRLIWSCPLIGLHRRRTVKRKLMEALGGKIEIMVIGAGKLDYKVEKRLADMHFPYTCGHGISECGPMISYEYPKQFRFGSVGKVVDRMEVRIDSPKPYSEPGEILVRGDNVMLGYYGNMNLTNAVLTDAGWMRTGDKGIIDRKGNLFLTGEHLERFVNEET